jgi:CubicO group peptidase (beta-lactamase class C family)
MDNLFQQIDAIFAAYDSTHTPGCALAIGKGGSVFYERGYGMANFDYDIPIRPDSVFHVASVSKQFAAFAIHLLASEGKLSLDDDIRKHLPEMPEYEHVVTVRHLVHHTSGLRDQWDVLEMAGWEYEGDVISNRHVLNMAQCQRGLNFKPGDEYLYSNAGYTLMALIVERCSGQSFRQFTHERVFQPLGMAHTHFHDDHNEIVPQRATGYDTKDGGYRISIPSFDTVGATSLFTTAQDLTRWATNYVDRKVGGAAIETMLQPYALNNGRQIRYRGGILVDDYQGVRRVSHSGGDAGYRSQFNVYPEHNLSIIVLSNFSNAVPSALANKVADLLLKDALKPVEIANAYQVPADQLGDYAGMYHQPQTHEVGEITLNEGQLLIWGGAPLHPRSADRFQIGEYPLFVVFKRDANGQVSGHAVEPNDQGHPYFEKISPAEPNVEQLSAYVGRYASDELATFYDVVLDNDKLILRHLRHADASLTPTYQDAFRIAGYAEVVFGRDSDGQVQTFTFYTSRVRGITLVRE